MNTLSVLYARHRQNVPVTGIAPLTIHFSELTLLLKGEMEYAAGGRALPLKSGDVVFLPAGTVRSRKDSSQTCDYVSFNFRTETELHLPLLIQGGITREILFLLSSFDEWRGKGMPIKGEEKPRHLLSLILLTLEEDLKVKKLHPLVLQVESYLKKNLNRPITLSDVASHCFFSPVYCDALFRKETGSSIIDRLIHLRITEACHLLIQGQHSVSHIAALTGFRDANYFSRLFKKRTGYTPSAYRSRFLSQE